MGVAERLLLALSRATDEPDQNQEEWTSENALSLLHRTIPRRFLELEGRHVIDFGCGQGFQTLALARAGASHVCGLDTNADALDAARERVAAEPEVDRISFAFTADQLPQAAFDLVISQNSMEHFPNPEGALRLMRRLVRPDGFVILTFGPPWFAPYGSHMHFFTAVPWVQLLFSERTVMNVRRQFRNDGATRYEEVPGGLNRMTVEKFERLVADSGLSVAYRRYECVRGWNALGRLPLVRELFVNHIACVLRPSR